MQGVWQLGKPDTEGRGSGAGQRRAVRGRGHVLEPLKVSNFLTGGERIGA